MFVAPNHVAGASPVFPASLSVPAHDLEYGMGMLDRFLRAVMEGRPVSRGHVTEFLNPALVLNIQSPLLWSRESIVALELTREALAGSKMGLNLADCTDPDGALLSCVASTCSLYVRCSRDLEGLRGEALRACTEALVGMAVSLCCISQALSPAGRQAGRGSIDCATESIERAMAATQRLRVLDPAKTHASEALVEWAVCASAALCLLASSCPPQLAPAVEKAKRLVRMAART